MNVGLSPVTFSSSSVTVECGVFLLAYFSSFNGSQKTLFFFINASQKQPQALQVRH
jgi:hypothetical protein